MMIKKMARRSMVFLLILITNRILYNITIRVDKTATSVEVSKTTRIPQLQAGSFRQIIATLLATKIVEFRQKK